MLVTAVDVVDEANDAARLIPMVDQAEEVTGAKVPMTMADAGYFSGKQVAMSDMARPTSHPYHKDQLVYDPESDSYICPHAQRIPYAGGKNKRASARLCRMTKESAAACRD